MWCLRKTNSSSSRSRGPISTHKHCLGTNINLVMGPKGDRSQERLCWRGPAAICWALTWTKLCVPYPKPKTNCSMCNCTTPRVVTDENMVMSPARPKTKDDTVVTEISANLADLMELFLHTTSKSGAHLDISSWGQTCYLYWA
jgi:hypothetical protein